jgi:DNA-directed RNA polymerase
MLRTPLLADTIMDKELELERRAAEDGAARYEAMSQAAIDRGEGAQLQPAERMLAAWYLPLLAEIRRERTRCVMGKAGAGRAVYGPILAAIKIKPATAIVLHEAMSHAMQCPRGVTLTKVSYAIGSAMVAEIHANAFSDRKIDTKELDALIRRKGQKIPRAINHWAKQTLDDHVWARRVCTMLGQAMVWKLIDAATLDAMPCFVVRPLWQNGKRVNHLVLTDGVQRLIADAQLLRSGMRPRFAPMVVPPLPWGKDGDKLMEGGHYRLRTPFVVRTSRSLRDRLRTAPMNQVFDAVNSLSATEWQIDPFIKDTISALLSQGGGVASIPRADPIPLPPKPAGLEGLKEWQREAAQIYEANRKAYSSRNDLLLALNLADRLVDSPVIWFPHQLDFRSRCYPVPLHLNHVGEDPRRAMLRFAKSVPPDMDAIKIHAANCYGRGVDKKPFWERVAFCDNNARDMEAFQADPLKHDGWMDAEDPFQFLAACRAMFDPKAAAKLPVQADGSNNGLQHYAAMGRDEISGRAVNLLPGELPSDVYMEVGMISCRKVMDLADAGDATGKLILSKVTELNKWRKLVKQNVMTSVYGVTRTGAREQLVPRLLELGMERKDVAKAASWLAKVTMESIGEKCIAASEIMGWLKSSVRQIVLKDRTRPIEWTTPLGFPVLQPYWNQHRLRVKTSVSPWELHLDVPDENDNQHLGRNVNGIAPNWVHSIDASHMMLTALRCQEEGIEFAAVHDSFWTHAGTARPLSSALRDEFVALHEQPLLENLKQSWERHYDITLSSLPPTGTLNLNDVRDSKYFFA